MKKYILLFALSLLGLQVALQAQKGFAYQAILRDANGALITNEQIDVLFAIIKDDGQCDGIGGVEVYKELHNNIQVNEFGLITLTVGGGTLQGSGSFAAIPWEHGCMFLQVEVDRPNQPSVTLGTSPISNVPTAIYALNGEGTDRTPEYRGPSNFILPGTNINVQLAQSYVWAKNHHLYLLFTTPLAFNWIQAQEMARIAGGHLVTVTSSAENDFIVSNILTHPGALGDVPIGYTDILSLETRWDWVTGEIALTSNVSIFSYWNPGQPSNTGGESIAHYYAHNTTTARYWNDRNADASVYHAVIVEFEFLTSP